MKEYSTYLFDVDGTLIDTAELIFQCFKYSTKRFADIEVPRELVMNHIGLPFKPQLETYIGPVSDSECDSIFEAHIAYQKEVYSQYLRLFDGIEPLLKKLTSQGKKLGIVTSRKKDTLSLYLKETGIDSYFTVQITPEDTTNHKPHPEPIIKALELLGSSPENSVYIGDSVFDIESGDRAKCDTAFVEWSQVHHSNCHVTPSYILSSPLDLLHFEK